MGRGRGEGQGGGRSRIPQPHLLQLLRTENMQRKRGRPGLPVLLPWVTHSYPGQGSPEGQRDEPMNQEPGLALGNPQHPPRSRRRLPPAQVQRVHLPEIPSS